MCRGQEGGDLIGLDLNGKAALVIGGTRGLGGEIALRLAGCGCQAAAVARTSRLICRQHCISFRPMSAIPRNAPGWWGRGRRGLVGWISGARINGDGGGERPYFLDLAKGN